MKTTLTRSILFALALLVLASGPGIAQTLVPSGATWKYLDNGSNQGTAWRESTFIDAGWPSGAAQLGYGDGDEATVVSYGTDSNNKYVTTYFRHTFSVADPATYSGLRLQVLRDDGIVVYLNGMEVFRDNLPSGTVSYSTFASTALGGSSETTFVETTVSPSLLISGANVLAVEIHQANGASSDISFDLQLDGNTARDLVTRGPYLQQGTPTSMILRWRTDVASDSRVRYGIDRANLSGIASDAAITTEHIVRITGLTPATRYFYELGNSQYWFVGDTNDLFVTSPAPGTQQPTRLWVIGDSGTADSNAAAVRDAYLSYTAARPADLWLMLGDNAYTNGTDAEYQAAVFNMYSSILQNTVLWPTRGNHESDSGGSGSTYYNIFSLPTGGEAGGLASGTEAYYSFDYANIHFICLDSYGSNRSASGTMANWLRNDLAATAQDWIIAFWHHPPYSKGSHDSDAEAELRDMRANFLPILESGGVDLVLSGHSHSYERSFLLDGHYGTSGTLVQSMKIDSGSGREDGSGAYQKLEGRLGNQGAVYAVAGSSGKTAGGTLNHPAMFISLNELGSLLLDVNASRLDAIFLRPNGTLGDYFTIVKSAATSTPLVAPSGLIATAVSSAEIALAWADNSSDEQSFRIERSTDGSSFTEIAMVGANVTNYSSTGLNPSTTYYYRVRASNGGDTSAYSNTAGATTAPGAATTTYQAENAILVGAVVDNRHPGYTGTGFVDYVNATGDYIEWSIDVPSAGSFRLDFRYALGASTNRPLALTVNQMVVTSSLSFPPTGSWTTWGTAGMSVSLNTGGNTIRLTAVGSSGPNMDSLTINTAPATPTPPAAPSDLTANPVSASQINLTWTDNSSDEVSFRIERSPDGSIFTEIAAVGANVTNYSSNGLTSSTTYYYRVRASNSDSNSAYSNTASAATAAGIPTTAYQAENATFVGAVFDNRHPGYTGTGFVDYLNSSGDYIEWTIDVPSDGIYRLDFRYALGSTTNRPLALSVNQTVVTNSLSFPPTGSWTTWGITGMSVSLNAGGNIIRLTAAGSSGANMDSLTIGQ